MGTLLVTVVGPSGRRDLSLPSDSPIHELLATLVRLVGEPEGGTEDDAWVLSLAATAEDPLRPEDTLTAGGVLDGSVLYLARAKPVPDGQPPARPPAPDELSPIQRTAALLPPRVGPVVRLGRAVGALFRAGRGDAQGSEDDDAGRHSPSPSLSVLSAPERVTPAQRMRRAWRSTDYLERLDAAIVAPGLRRCVTIAMVSPKGGVGKTTVTALLGMLLALLRRDRIIAVDTNPDFGSLGRVLTPEHRLFVDDLLEWLDQPGVTLTALDAQLGRGPHGLMVLPAPTDPARMWRLDETAYRNVIERLQAFVGVLLLDCGTGLHEPAAGAAIKSSDLLVLVTDAEPAAASLVAEAGQLLVRAGRPITLVVNKMPRRGSPLDLGQFARSLPEASGLVVIPREPEAAARLAAARFDWRDAPPAWQRAIRELAVQIVSDWPALGLTLQRPTSRRA